MRCGIKRRTNGVLRGLSVLYVDVASVPVAGNSSKGLLSRTGEPWRAHVSWGVHQQVDLHQAEPRRAARPSECMHQPLATHRLALVVLGDDPVQRLVYVHVVLHGKLRMGRVAVAFKPGRGRSRS